MTGVDWVAWYRNHYVQPIEREDELAATAAQEDRKLTRVSRETVGSFPIQHKTMSRQQVYLQGQLQ